MIEFSSIFQSIMYVLNCINIIGLGFFLTVTLIIFSDNKNLKKVIFISFLIVLDVFVFIFPEMFNLIVFAVTGKMI